MKNKAKLFSLLLAVTMLVCNFSTSNAMSLDKMTIIQSSEDSKTILMEPAEELVTKEPELSNKIFKLFKDNNISEKQGMYIRTAVDYEPSYTSVDWYYKQVGFIAGDNRDGSSPLTVSLEYSKSDSITASLGGYVEGSTEAGVILAKTEVTVGMNLSFSRSWTKGSKTGANYSIPAGAFENVAAYIPAMKTAGRLKYKVYMDSNPSNVFYEYKTLYASYAPMSDGVVIKTSKVR